MKINFSNYLLSKFDFDFFTIYIRATDPLQHIFFKYYFPEKYTSLETEKKLFKDIISDYYIYLDKVIGNLIKKWEKT